jgi:hypothetical protein
MKGDISDVKDTASAKKEDSKESDKPKEEVN